MNAAFTLLEASSVAVNPVSFQRAERNNSISLTFIWSYGEKLNSQTQNQRYGQSAYTNQYNIDTLIKPMYINFSLLICIFQHLNKRQIQKAQDQY